MGHSNAFNFSLVLVVGLPSILFDVLFLHGCGQSGTELEENHVWGRVCEWGQKHPLYLINVLTFLNLDILFWIIGLIQGNFWLVDPYWTIIPVLIGIFYATHPSAQSDWSRSAAVFAVLALWSIRLEYTYLRREEWQWGRREDWRFTEMKKKNPKHWWWMAFFVALVSQHIFLVGLTLPLYAVFTNANPWGVWDGVAVFLCISGIIIAHFADSQLYHFVYKNQLLKDIGAPKVPLLNSGLWYYSRHPNYFGEQLFWWGLSLFAWNLGQGWTFIGNVINAACLAQVTRMVEQRMLRDETRAEVYREYQQTTSVWVPWFKFKSRIAKEKVKAKSH